MWDEVITQVEVETGGNDLCKEVKLSNSSQAMAMALHSY